MHDINCRCWGAWAFGKPGCSGPQNHPFLVPLVQFASAPLFSKPLVPTSPSPELVCKCFGVQYVMMDRYFCHLKFLPIFLISSFHVGRSTDIPMGSPSHLPDLPPPPPTRRVGGWPQSDLFWERWLPVSEGSSLPWRGVEQGSESPQFLLEVSSGPTPAGDWTENPPPQFGGCCLLHCPAPLTAPPEFRAGGY